jgi:hypothetical protein
MTTKYRRKHRQEEGGDMIHWLKVGMVVFAAAGTVVGSVWAASEYVQTLATKNELVVVQAQAQTALDTQMEDIMARIARLEAIRNKTADDRDQIKYLRDQLERLRKMRSIK